ncbi:mekA [Symbiodinium sp. CCMP2592]|nr:mekA [Symbiodinium sp. CCMP2592]
MDLELLLPASAFPERRDLWLLKRFGAQLEGVDMANWTAATWQPGLFSRAGHRPILRRRLGLWRCGLRYSITLANYYLECLAPCEREDTLLPELYPLYKRRDYDGFCALLHVFAARAVWPEEIAAKDWVGNATDGDLQPLCSPISPDAGPNLCEPAMPLLPLRRASLGGLTVPRARDEEYFLTRHLRSRLHDRNFQWKCLALPIKDFSKRNHLIIVHGDQTFPQLAARHLLALALHLSVQLSPLLWSELLSDDCMQLLASVRSRSRMVAGPRAATEAPAAPGARQCAAASLELDNEEEWATSGPFSSNWSFDWTGTLRHRESDLSISPTKGVSCGGQEYPLAAGDLPWLARDPHEGAPARNTLGFRVGV